MSIATVAWALKQDVPSATQKYVLIVLANYANHDGQAWPSVKLLMKDTGLSDRTVQIALRELVDSGIISKETRECENGRSRSNRYIFPDLEASDRGNEVRGRGKDVRGEGEPGSPTRGKDVHPHYVEPLDRTVKKNSSAKLKRPDDWPENYQDQVWDLYAKKRAKQDSMAALDKLAAEGKTSWATLTLAIRRFVQVEPDPQFRPDLVRFIKKRRWVDEDLLQPTKPNGMNGHSHGKSNGAGSGYNYGEDDGTGKPICPPGHEPRYLDRPPGMPDGMWEKERFRIRLRGSC